VTNQPVGIAGIGLTAFGRRPGPGPIELMAEAADLALADAGLDRARIDGLITGYATTLPHLMLADLFAEHYGLQPRHAHAVQAGGATGAMMLVLARHLIAAGAAETVLVVAGENRLSGQSRDDSIKTLAQVGHATLEVPSGAIVPAYYALLASRYLHETGAREADLAELAVLMRRHAQNHPGAHLRKPMTVADVLASPPIATPLKFMDCCPISDGACAFVVTRDAYAPRTIRITGWGEGHTHQHVSAAPDDVALGARLATERALSQAGRRREEIDYLGIYDSFTATLAILLEATGFAAPGQAGHDAAAGRFAQDGRYPLNLHGGLLSYGHCGVAGSMAMIAETVLQLRGEAGARQVPPAHAAFVHTDGGVLSAHVSLVLERAA
jgi:acetyl-CoA acetyltransferase